MLLSSFQMLSQSLLFISVWQCHLREFFCFNKGNNIKKKREKKEVIVIVIGSTATAKKKQNIKIY